jgi:hypothetical protein
VHDALQDHVVVELAGLETLAADDAVVELGDARLADVDARTAELGARVGRIREQCADVAAPFLVDVVTVSALQAFDGLRVLEQLRVVLERGDLGLERAEAREVAGLLRAAALRQEQQRAESGEAREPQRRGARRNVAPLAGRDMPVLDLSAPRI